MPSFPGTATLTRHDTPSWLLEYVLHQQPQLLPGVHVMELVMQGGEVCERRVCRVCVGKWRVCEWRVCMCVEGV